MFALGVCSYQGLAVGTSLTVALVTVLAALTLLPAVLGFCRHAAGPLGAASPRGHCPATSSRRLVPLGPRRAAPPVLAAAARHARSSSGARRPALHASGGLRRRRRQPDRQRRPPGLRPLAKGFGPGLQRPTPACATDRVPAEQRHSRESRLVDRPRQTPGVAGSAARAEPRTGPPRSRSPADVAPGAQTDRPPRHLRSQVVPSAS